MKEFDFDELDRAVNSVLEDERYKDGLVSSSRPNSSSSVESERQAPIVSSRERISSRTVHSRTMASARPSRKVISPLGSEPSERTVSAPESDHPTLLDRKNESQVESIAPARPLARRRSGRFMDVVHPSSDMKTASMGHSSRKGKTITPPSEEPEKSFGSAASEIDKLDLGDDQLLSQQVADILKDDPLGDNTKSDSTDSGQKEKLTVDEVADEVESALDDKSITPPLTSPFIEDAQVEKRPLGGRTLKPLDNASNPDDTSDNTESKDSSEPDLTEINSENLEVDTPLDVDKLHEKIEAIEAAQLDAEAATPETVTIFSIDDKSSASQESSAPTSNDKEGELSLGSEAKGKEEVDGREDGQVGNVDVDSGSNSEDKSSPDVGGPTSIAKQYKEVPRVASEDDTSPIFDPENYQQTLDHESKSKSGWIWVVAIVILLLLGAGVAVFLWQSGVLAVSIS
ncbi:hypothetical protein GX865_02530 [Candidatus Saccharibacteria bacterium]|nr:hypothetical protein [Candidatus Saccharibacteria bacterium]